MEGWTIAGVVIAFIVLLIGIVTPIIKLNTVIARLSAIVDSIGKNLESLTTKNSETHGKLWDRIEAQDETLSDHDKRIALIEQLKQGDEKCLKLPNG